MGAISDIVISQRGAHLVHRLAWWPCCAALPVLVVDDVDDEISGVPTSFNRIPSLQRIFLLGLSLKLSLNGSCDIRFPFFLSALLQTLDGSEWMNRTSMILRCLMLVKEKTRSSSWENRQFGRPSKLFAVQCMEGACHRLQPWESVSGAKMSGCSATGYLPIRGWQCLM